MGRRHISVRFLVAGSVLVLVATLFVGAAAGAPTPSGARFASEKLFGPKDDWEPTVAADPSSNWVYQLVTGIDSRECTDPSGANKCPGTSVVFSASSDGGKTWGAHTFPCGIACSGVGWQFDPQLAVANDGTIYAAWLNTFDPGAVLLKSSDHGQTWTAPLAVDGPLTYSDKEILAISANGKDVYLAFNGKLKSWAVASHDYGASFAAPVKTNNDDLWWYTEGGVVAPNGDVYFSESGESGKVLHGTQLKFNSLDGPTRIAVIRSADGGVTWTTKFFETSAAPPACPVFQCYPDYLAATASIAVDPAGTLLLAYTFNTSDGAQKALYSRTSTDGRKWSRPTLVNARGDSDFEEVEAGPTADDFRVVWQDNRNGSRSSFGGWNTYFKRTTNGGSSWSSNVRLSDLSSGAPYKSSAGYTWTFGDYLGLAVGSSGTNFAIWGESDGSSIYCCGGSWYTKGG